MASTRRVAVFLLVAAALVAYAAAECTTDADCPGSYCQNDHGPGPFVCHACGDFCCLQDTDCTAKCAKGAYCMIYPGKHYPYYCHSERCNITAVDEEIAKA